MQTQKWVADWYQRLWPGAGTQGSGRKGQDITGVPVDIEVKARKGFSPLEAIRQLRARPAGDFGPGWIVMRMDKQGEAAVPDYLVLMTLADHTTYIAELKDLRDWQKGYAQAYGQRSPDAVHAELDAAVKLVRDILVAVAEGDNVSLESSAEPGTPARNYELAERIGIGHILGNPGG